jgi:undecaprenyl-diphosphatase
MGIVEAIIIGVVQGLSEFLPVSSSGHIELAKEVLQVPNEGMLFTIIVHAATALSTILIFWKDIVEIIKGLLQFKWNEQFKFALNIVLSMIPAVVIGLLFEEEIDSFFTGNVLLVGFMLLVTGSLLFLADRAKSSTKGVGAKEAIIIGISQAVAILPGISRSGATIGTSVLLGVDRSKAARFSFLMVVPLILGKMAKDILSGELFEVDAATGETLLNSSDIMALFAGFVAAFVTGLFACKWMISLVKKAQLKYFSYYCFVVGIIAITYASF